MNGHLVFKRNEIKYVITLETAHEIRKVIRQNIPLHSFKKGKVITFVTTIYFDTPDFFFYQASRSNPGNNIKLRAKEYYYFDTELIEHASSYESLFEYSPQIFLEIKKRSGDETQKFRITLDKKQVAGIIATGSIPPDIKQSIPDDDQLRGFMKNLNTMRDDAAGKPIIPVSLVNYQRNAFQDDDTNIRVSFDHEIQYYAAPDDILLSDKTLTKENLSLATGTEQNAIMEIKYIDTIPEWLKTICASQTGSSISKFCNCCASILNNKGSLPA